jgi:phosphate transport system substrate-binding protein
MKRIIFLTALLALSCHSFALAVEELRYIGSSTVGTGVLQAGAVDAFTKKTGIKFAAIELTGSGKGIQAVFEGQTPLGGASRPLKAEEKKQKLVGTIIGYDAIAIFVHASNPVNNLSKEQLKGIFTGVIKNWKEVGGKDAPITPNSEIQGDKRATMEMFTELVLDGAAHGKSIKEIMLPRDQIIDVAANPNAICSVSLGLLASLSADQRSKVKAISVNSLEPNDSNVQSGAYPISRPLLLVSQGLPKGQVKEFISFILSPEGQTIVSKNFVPIRR